MYCICCKEDTVLPYDIKYPDGKSKLTESDHLWDKHQLKTHTLKQLITEV